MILGAARWVPRSLAVVHGRVLGLLVALCGLLGLWGVAFAPGAAAAACQTGTVTFLSTGEEQCYVVPSGVTDLQVAAVGAPGGNFGSGHGFGAAVGAFVPVSSGETLYVEVGGAAAAVGGIAGGPGGFNGGGAGGTGGGLPGGPGGGGASDVRSVSSSTGGELSLGSRLLVAGGGGGGSAGGNADGPGSGFFAGMGGGAGGIAGGGAGGNSPTCNPPAESVGSPGTFGQAGAGGSGESGAIGTDGAGGGGGGYYGGGGGQGGTQGGFGGCASTIAGGGGGGSYVTPSASAVTYATDSSGAPNVQITPQTPAAPPHGPPGPQGQTGATGAAGATGQTGATGPAGQIELVVCNKVTKTTVTNGHKHKTTVQHCTTRLVSGPVTFKIESDDLGATLTRAHRAYATGVAVPTAAGRWQLVLTHQIRQLHPGRYTLILRTLHGQRRIVQRTTVTIT